MIYQTSEKLTYRRWRQVRSLSLEMRKWRRIVRHIGEHQPLLIVIFTENLILTQVETITHAEPVKKEKNTI